MAATVRPRRSVLYMPGANARAMEKAQGLPADALIMDLEDAVAPDAKISAREQIVSALAAHDYGEREVIVRINGLETEWAEGDIAAFATCGAHALLIPKVENAAMVQRVEALMAGGGAPDSMAIWCMMETPLGILNAVEIAGASARLAAFVMGTSDLTKDLHARHTALRLPLLTSASLCILAARAHGLAILDGVHLDLSDDDGFEAICVQGVELGFDGKTLIHPKTLAAANRVYGPTDEEVAWSERIIHAHGEAEAEGKGVVLVDGKLIENLHVEEAHRIVTLARHIEALETAA